MKTKHRLSYAFVPVPCWMVNEGLPLSLGELRLYIYLLRHLESFGNKDVRLTDEELMHGRKKKGGDRMDKGCNLTAKPLKAAREALIKRGLINVLENLSDPARPVRHYSLNTASFSKIGVTPTCLGETPTHLGESPSEMGATPTRTYSRDSMKDSMRDIKEIPPKSPTGEWGVDSFKKEIWELSNKTGEEALAHFQYKKALERGFLPQQIREGLVKQKAFDDKNRCPVNCRKSVSIFLRDDLFLKAPIENGYQSNQRVAKREAAWQEEKQKLNQVPTMLNDLTKDLVQKVGCSAYGKAV